LKELIFMTETKFARRVALLVPRDEKGRILLQHRSKDAKVQPDYWAFFGGGIEENETPEEALKRETAEELGIEPTGFDLFKRYEFQEPPGLFEKFVFVIPLKHSIELLKRKQMEGQDLGLFSFDELKGLKISDNDMAVLKELFGKK